MRLNKILKNEIPTTINKEAPEFTPKILGSAIGFLVMDCISTPEILRDAPAIIPKIVHTFYLIALIAVPILLVIFGSIDFVKSLVGQKDDEIKKGRQIFIKRLITGVLVFFILSIVRLIVSIADDDSSNGVFRVLDCVNCFIENDC